MAAVARRDASNTMPRPEPKWIRREIKDLPKPCVREASWYVVYTASQAEVRVAFALWERGYQAYLPVVKKIARPLRAPKPVEMLRPAFPRYVFLGLPDGANWAAARRIVGLEEVICRNNSSGLVAPIRLAHTDIEDLMAAEDMDFFDDVTLRIGERVEIVSGLFAGYAATVERAPRKVDKDAYIELLGNTIRLPLEMLRRR